MRRTQALLALLCLITASAEAKSRRKSSGGRGAFPPGVFDYYVLSLSWSPLYCADPGKAQRDVAQCGEGRRFAFVTHGLWPNNETPPHPRDCGRVQPVPSSLVSQMLPIMPSPGLIQHEWRSHGACSALAVQDYFAKVRAAYRLVNIPDRYRQPTTDLVVPAATLRADFRRANPGIAPASMRFVCSGANLRELRVCLTDQLRPRPCASSVRDTCGERDIRMLRVR